MNLQRMIWIAALVLLAAGCSEGGEEVASDGEFDNALTNGKADSALSECQLDAMLLLHLGLVIVLMFVFPISKLLHAPGLFFSPTRNQADNPRERRHMPAGSRV